MLFKLYQTVSCEKDVDFCFLYWQVWFYVRISAKTIEFLVDVLENLYKNLTEKGDNRLCRNTAQ